MRRVKWWEFERRLHGRAAKDVLDMPNQPILSVARQPVAEPAIKTQHRTKKIFCFFFVVILFK